jgi:methionyl-tRNA synthetase
VLEVQEVQIEFLIKEASWQFMDTQRKLLVSFHNFIGTSSQTRKECLAVAEHMLHTGILEGFFYRLGFLRHQPDRQ